MKTTLDLPDDLLIEAKAVAARRRTTLKQMVEHALRRELAGAPSATLKVSDAFYEIGENGLARLKKRGAKVTSEMVYKMMEDEGI